MRAVRRASIKKGYDKNAYVTEHIDKYYIKMLKSGTTLVEAKLSNRKYIWVVQTGKGLSEIFKTERQFLNCRSVFTSVLLLYTETV